MCLSFRNCTLPMVFLFVLMGMAHADITVHRPSMSYSLTLPAGWVIDSSCDSQEYYYDGTGVRQSYLSVKKRSFPCAEFTDADEWTRSRFIAYLISVRYSYEPFGTIIFFDSSATTTVSAKDNTSLWAPIAYSQYLSTDTALGSWSEVLMYCAWGETGYECYAIGDTIDIKNNLVFYETILRSLRIDTHEFHCSAGMQNTPFRVHRPSKSTGIQKQAIFDMRGRMAGFIDESGYFTENRGVTPFCAADGIRVLYPMRY